MILSKLFIPRMKNGFFEPFEAQYTRNFVIGIRNILYVLLVSYIIYNWIVGFVSPGHLYLFGLDGVKDFIRGDTFLYVGQFVIGPLASIFFFAFFMLIFLFFTTITALALSFPFAILGFPVRLITGSWFVVDIAFHIWVIIGCLPAKLVFESIFFNYIGYLNPDKKDQVN